MENPIKMDDLGGFPIIFGNTHLGVYLSPQKGRERVPLLGTITYPLPVGTFESMLVRLRVRVQIGGHHLNPGTLKLSFRFPDHYLDVPGSVGKRLVSGS